MHTDILLVAETVDNRISPTSEELSGLAVCLSPEGEGRSRFFIAGSDIAAQARTFAKQTGYAAEVVENAAFQYPNPDLLADAVVDLAAGSPFDYICFLHTAAGCQAAAGTAVKLGAACVSGVNGLRAVDGGFVFQRALFNGKLDMEVKAMTSPVVITILPGAFGRQGDERNLPPRPEVIVRQWHDARPACQPRGISADTDTDTSIDQADIIIAAGRGIGSADNLALVNRLARLFPNAAVAASRPLCDMKWLPYSRQVGATGKTVSPKLYLACGISGSQQHVYGMKDSQWIVAINTDPNAAIFSVADLCIVEDVTAFLPLLAELYEKRRVGEVRDK